MPLLLKTFSIIMAVVLGAVPSAALAACEEPNAAKPVKESDAPAQSEPAPPGAIGAGRSVAARPLAHLLAALDTRALHLLPRWPGAVDTDIAVSQHPQYLLLTCEVQDKSWAGSPPEGGYGSREESQTKMEVDWVRVWQKSPQP